MKVLRIPRLSRRVVAGAALLAIVGGGGYAVASTPSSASTRHHGLIQIPPYAVTQADGVQALPPLPPIEGPGAVTSAQQGGILTETPALPTSGLTTTGTAAGGGIPAAALAAYKNAADILATAAPLCKIDWALIAGIGKVESDHGRWGGNVIDTGGVTLPGIFGLPLNGNNRTALIRDTDRGVYDRDTTYDRAVGPMQFIPGTWRAVGVDADGDGRANPQDLNDAAAATAVYLCSGHADLATPAGLTSAILRYNNSMDYVREVTGYADAYRGGVTVIPNGLIPASIYGLTPFLPSGDQRTESQYGGNGPTGTASPTSSASGSSTSSSTKPKPTKPATKGSTTTGQPGSTGTTKPLLPGPSTSGSGSSDPLAPVTSIINGLLPKPSTKPSAKPSASRTAPALPSVPAPPVAVGDTVKILSGTLLGLTGKITAVDPTKKVATLLVSVLGLTQNVDLPWTSLQKL